MIFCDPTELRAGSKLPAAVAQVVQPLPNLEAVTGADLFIDPQDEPIGYDITKMPGMARFNARLRRGMLVQRKTGLDLLHSIPQLRTILTRMYATGSMCWLLPVGRFWRDRMGKVVYSNGFQTQVTEWAWNSYTGALDAWQIRGGYLRTCDFDDDAIEWLLSWDEKIKAFAAAGDQVLVQRPTAPKGVVMHARPWVVTLETFPGIGPEKADAIADYCANLAYALMWLSGPEEGVPGVGKKTKDTIRRYMGLSEGQALLVGSDESLKGGDDDGLGTTSEGDLARAVAAIV